MLDEYRRVLEEMTKTRPLPVFPSILEIIEVHAVLVEPVTFAKAVCSDPDDDKFLEAAVAADARYVVSGDSALLNLKKHRGTEIVRPARFLNLLPQSV